MVYERNMKITIWACWFQNKLVYEIALLVVIYRFLRFWYFILQKAGYVLFLSFWFYKRYIFVINPCDPYWWFVGAESCIKVCFGSFGSIQANLWSITLLVYISYCHYFCCLAACCLYFFYKKDIISSFLKKVENGFKMFKHKSIKPWTSFNKFN